MKSQDELLSIFSSRGRVKILRYLLKVGEANITNIAKATKLHHHTVEKHLRKLVELGIIEEQRIGRLRIFRVLWLNPKINALKELIEAFE